MCIQSVRIPAVQLRRMRTCVIHFVVQSDSGGGNRVLGEGRMGGGGGAEWRGEGRGSSHHIRPYVSMQDLNSGMALQADTRPCADMGDMYCSIITAIAGLRVLSPHVLVIHWIIAPI